MLKRWIQTTILSAIVLGCELYAAEAPRTSLNALDADTRVLLSKTIVSVRADGMDSGSGIVVSSSGLIVTSSTLIRRGQNSVQIRFADGQAYSAGIVATDSGTESALLKIVLREPRDFAFLPLGESIAIHVGSAAMSAGNPLDSIMTDRQVAVSSGTITGLYNVCSADGASHYCGPALETDVAINAGSEGGAVLNIAGQVIGMACLAVDGVRRMGTAVPISAIKAAYGHFLKDDSSAHKTATQSNVKLNDSTDDAARAVVIIRSHSGSETVAGVVIDEAGTILTSGTFSAGQHVHVEYCGGSVGATVQRQSDRLDVSLLKLDAQLKLPWIALKDASPVVAGIRISVVSKTGVCDTPAICHGIVSATGRFDGVAAQTDARLTTCNMGSAILNRRGDLIGLVAHSKMMCKCQAQNAGVSFFTPSNVIRAWMDEANPLVSTLSPTPGDK